jgi:hypothetical protein
VGRFFVSAVLPFGELTVIGGCISVIIMFSNIGGHSVGSSIVLCNCNSKTYLFCGDECYVKDCFVHHVPTGSSYDFATSKKFIHDYSDERYGFLLFHDPEIMKGRIGCKIVQNDKN